MTVENLNRTLGILLKLLDLVIAGFTLWLLIRKA